VPVGTNLADVERWMIFATLQKCGGNKTRAAALLGVSLKTLYNRLNAYRAQGLVMDYAATAGRDARDIEITGLHADLADDLTEVPL
jgi:Response regulator containing CheY-like receiver, AAA-type ATPase, and DNA-binding domains